MKLFKGNSDEIKVTDAVGPVFDQTDLALNQMFSEVEDSKAFLLMLYDNGLVPFSDRIKRDAFVNFYREALTRFPMTGTFEAYLFILRGIFGEDSEIFFDTDMPGALSITLNIADEIARDFEGYDSSGTFLIETQDGLDTIAFRSLSGLETESDVKLLFSEIIPEGIIPTLFINFYEFWNFIAWDGLGVYDMIDDAGDTIVFYTIRG